jgi:hypothetical protein
MKRFPPVSPGYAPNNQPTENASRYASGNAEGIVLPVSSASRAADAKNAGFINEHPADGGGMKLVQFRKLFGRVFLFF